MSSESVTLEKNITDTEDELTNEKAEQELREQFIGEPSTATIIDYYTAEESTDDWVVGDFIVELQLPTGDVDTVVWNQRERRDGELDSFLEYHNCTRSDCANLYWSETPVAYTEHNSWVMYYPWEGFEGTGCDRMKKDEMRYHSITSDGMVMPKSWVYSGAFASFFLSGFLIPSIPMFQGTHLITWIAVSCMMMIPYIITLSILSAGMAPKRKGLTKNY